MIEKGRLGNPSIFLSFHYLRNTLSLFLPYVKEHTREINRVSALAGAGEKERKEERKRGKGQTERQRAGESTHRRNKQEK